MEEEDPQRRRREDDPMVAEMRAALKELNTEWTSEVKLLRADMNHGLETLGNKMDFTARENAQRFQGLADGVKRVEARQDKHEVEVNARFEKVEAQTTDRRRWAVASVVIPLLSILVTIVVAVLAVGGAK